MKFGKLLKDNLDDLPGGGVVLPYKELKKQLKALNSLVAAAEAAQKECARDSSADVSATEAEASGRAPEEGSAQSSRPGKGGTPTVAQEQASSAARAFVEELNRNMTQINEYYIEREEDSVIRIKCLEDELANTVAKDDLVSLQHRFADLHGDLVLLMHWSLLNYAALAKILKKHDKLMGSDLKDAYLATALRQPFSSTSVLSSLLWQAEKQLTKLQHVIRPQPDIVSDAHRAATASVVSHSADGATRAGASAEAPAAVAAPAVSGLSDASRYTGSGSSDASRYAAKTSAALNVWQQLRTNAKTPSTCNAHGLVLPAWNVRDHSASGAGSTGLPPAKRARKTLSY